MIGYRSLRKHSNFKQKEKVPLQCLSFVLANEMLKVMHIESLEGIHRTDMISLNFKLGRIAIHHAC